jgi:hypothetical protein
MPGRPVAARLHFKGGRPVPNISRLIASFGDRVLKQAEVNGREAALLLQDRLQDRLSRPYPPSSRPGEFPARRSGRLQRESYATSEVKGDSVVITVAQPTPYAERLSALGRLGTRAVVEETREQVLEIMLRKGFNNLERWARG